MDQLWHINWAFWHDVIISKVDTQELSVVVWIKNFPHRLMYLTHEYSLTGKVPKYNPISPQSVFPPSLVLRREEDKSVSLSGCCWVNDKMQATLSASSNGLTLLSSLLCLTICGSEYCQVDWIWNQLRHSPLDISVVAFPGWINCRKEDLPAEKDLLALSRSSLGMKSQRRNWCCLLAFASFWWVCLLWTGDLQLFRNPPSLQHPHRDGWCIRLCALNNYWFLSFSNAKSHCSATRSLQCKLIL